LAANPVMGIDLSPKQIERAEAIEQLEQLGIEYRIGDVMSLNLERRFDIVTAIHLLHYLENAAEIESALSGIHETLCDGGHFVTMIANLKNVASIAGRTGGHTPAEIDFILTRYDSDYTAWHDWIASEDRWSLLVLGRR
jgi:2-polyprenyl-3-methyl-5-hydroxy-6-metoxy-1,4-benzoquinol methylase